MAGRELAGEPPVGGVDVRLIDGAPQVHQVAQLIRRASHKGDECAHRVAVHPPALAREPQRACEVVQGDHRLDALLTKVAEHIAVVADLARVELAL